MIEPKRLSWDEAGMAIADTIAQRSGCVMRQVGAAIFDPRHRIVAVAYNGPPADYPVSCASGCPRAREGAVIGAQYDNCVSTHAEMNGLLVCDRRDREGGTIYVNTASCFTCAKAISNSGLKRTVMRVLPEDAHRDPQRSISFMQASGLEVITWQG